ncbi:MAG: hypothetical protein WDM80_02625 [Limisphaerales bacterium]
MKITLIIIWITLSQFCLSAAEVSTNFWDNFSDRVKTLHGFVVEVDVYCQKDEVKSLGLNTHGAIALGDIMKVFLKIKEEKPSSLTEIKKSIKVQLFLAEISEQTTSVTSRILAFSSLTREEKEEFVAKIERAGKLIKKLNQDLDEHIYDVSELGL